MRFLPRQEDIETIKNRYFKPLHLVGGTSSNSPTAYDYIHLYLLELSLHHRLYNAGCKILTISTNEEVRTEKYSSLVTHHLHGEMDRKMSWLN